MQHSLSLSQSQLASGSAASSSSGSRRTNVAAAPRAAVSPSSSVSSSSSSSASRRGRAIPTPSAVSVKDATSASAPAVVPVPAVSELDMSKTVLGIILGGGAGSRLYPLTKKRAKPAVPLGANYRLIDIPVSNCINSGVNKVYTLTQFNSASLNRHLAQAYNVNVGGYRSRGFVEVLAASQSVESKAWFQGTADAVRQYLWLFEEAVREGVEDYLILSGDHLYRMDYAAIVAAHRAAGADITVAALPCEEKDAEAFGVMKIDGSGRIIEFAEKVKGDALRAMRVDTSVLGIDAKRAAEAPYIASMGIYVAKASAIRELLSNAFPSANDFGSEVIPGATAAGMHVQAYAYDGYWEDIGTIQAFYDANLALTEAPDPKFSFYDRDAPIYTMSRFLPPSKVGSGSSIERSILGDGCVVRSGCKIAHSVVGLRSLIGANCEVTDTLMMGSDYYETLDECVNVRGCLPMGLGDGCVVRRAIIDKNARIGENVQIVNKANVQEANKKEDGYVIKDGIVIVIKDSVIAPGTVI